jgi:hypothetical protein
LPTVATAMRPPSSVAQNLICCLIAVMARVSRTNATIASLARAFIVPLVLQRVIGARVADQQSGKNLGSPAKISNVKLRTRRQARIGMTPHAPGCDGHHILSFPPMAGTIGEGSRLACRRDDASEKSH